ncbi:MULTISPECIES: archaeal proteasome endopeptidase complex subunit alpha [Haloferax]|uniref:Proteasome subunit alpha n=1 Tax=Haloferax marinum TaxID=2666143 RepID=A0A6A8G1Y4_9EURY|nr:MULTISPECIES: archaeal proteasome endopeptidase complex subunit alpha [Haloferax]KAB1196061.1 archaeal proteasome endopeptidase complex subunit alpha [Haloferax sp. CBA1150]MRW95041.1 archaeal proteasome endopeptidase complex subunit alpha [Haloferax marinum]
MNRNDKQAYDRGTSLFSPDGRIYQVEYAREAVKRGAPVVGIRTTDGVVLVGQRSSPSSLMETKSIEKIHKLDDHLGAASAGHVADARKLIDFARTTAQRERLRYGEPIGVEVLTKAVTDDIQESTQSGGRRPYGAALLIGGVENGRARLFATDPSGTPQEWKAVAIGGLRNDIQEALEAGYTDDMTLQDGLALALSALREANDELSAEDVNAVMLSEDGYTELDDEAVAEAFADAAPDEDEA